MKIISRVKKNCMQIHLFVLLLAYCKCVHAKCYDSSICICKVLYFACYNLHHANYNSLRDPIYLPQLMIDPNSTPPAGTELKTF